MTANTMSLDCDEFAARLADYLDGELSDGARGAMTAHASSCAACGQLLAEIESLRLDAATLPLLEPSRDLWAGIAERIDARVLPLDAPRIARVAAVRRTWRHPAVAAAALVLITAGVTHVWTRLSYETPVVTASGSQQVAVAPRVVVGSNIAEQSALVASVASVAPVARVATSTATRQSTVERRAPAAPAPRVLSGRADAPPATLASRLTSADVIFRSEVDPVYAREMVKLRAIVRERRAQLDPRTVAVLEQSIAVIDSAIAQSRAALAKDPASGFLASQLNHSLEKKVELLRTAALLPART